MREPTERGRLRVIPISLMVIMTTLISLVPSCESSTFVLGTLEGSGAPGGAGPCGEVGQGCEDSSDCCSAECVLEVCSVPIPGCRGGGVACSSSADCCSLSCVDDTCASACVSDGDACDGHTECCSGICDAGACVALNDTCLTSGNSCSASADCCSGLCERGFCSARSSFCAQTGDICYRPRDCCSQVCEMVEGRRVGTCTAPPQGRSFCTGGIAGSLCDGCNDCCSRLCIPFGNAGQHVCALAKGCRQTGELCSDNLDCCGGDPDSSLPGAGNVECARDGDETWGICRNAMSCSPQGNVCHLQDYSCGVSAAANKCCGAEGEEGQCVADGDDVPRCNGLGGSCLSLGDACATNEDCCDGSCRPTEDGGLTCQEAVECVVSDGHCTATSECCPGLWCERSLDDPFGRCSAERAVDCGLEGQICGTDEPECCGSLICELGLCRGDVQ